MNGRQTLLRAGERAAPMLRRLGLGALIDRTATRISGHLGSMEFAFEGFTIHTAEIGHVYYMRDLVDDEHDRYFRRVFVDAIPAGGTVLEGGAHLGVMTLFAARAVGPTGRVITFEPNAGTLPALQRNIDANGFHDRVKVVPLGLSAERATHTFFVSGGGETSSLHDPGTASRTITIETVPGDEMLPPDARIDVVKLDIEGHEVQALHGLRRSLRAAGAGLTVFAECNPGMLAKSGSTPDDLVAALRDCDLEVRWIDEGGRRVRDLDDGMPASGYVNLICTRPAAAVPES